MPRVIIQNYHSVGTASIIADFKALGYEVYAPATNFGFGTYLPNAGLGAQLIDYNQFVNMARSDDKPIVIIAAVFQRDTWLQEIRRYGLKSIVTTANRDADYGANVGDIALISNKQHYDKYEYDKPKLLYWRRPAMPDNLPRKCIEASWRERYVVQAIQNLHVHPQYKTALDFQARWQSLGYQCDLYGAGSPQGEIARDLIIRKRVNAYFMLHFKHSDGLGNALLESMLVGTPVVISSNLRNEHPGLMYIRDGETGFIADSAEDAIDKLCNLSLDDYRVMSAKCEALVTHYLDDDTRYAELRRILRHIEQ